MSGWPTVIEGLLFGPTTKKSAAPKLVLTGSRKGRRYPERMSMSISSMSSRVERDTPKRPSAAVRLLAELRSRAAHSPTRSVAVHRAELARALEVSDRTIKTATADLIGTGFVEVTGPQSRYAPNTYRVLV